MSGEDHAASLYSSLSIWGCFKTQFIAAKIYFKGRQNLHALATTLAHNVE